MTNTNGHILSQEEIKERARQEAREVLARSSAFQAMSQEEKLNTYKDMVLANARKLTEAQSNNNGNLSTQLKKRGSQTADRASDLIDDRRHKHDVGRGVEAFDDLVDTIDFPSFVKDLVKGVFDANIVVMKEQTDNFIQLMKEASKSAAQFIRQVSDEDAFSNLAEGNDDFNLSFDDETGDAKLQDKDGNDVDMDDNEVKARIMDSKIALAKEHRKTLQQIMLMGINRMVVDKGTIKAGVTFDFKSETTADFKDKAMNKYSKSSGGYGKFSGGLLGSILGGPSGGRSSSTRSTSVSVSSAKSAMKDELAAKLTGSVELQFSTDYFELDKFVDLYQIEAGETKEAEENK